MLYGTGGATACRAASATSAGGRADRCLSVAGLAAPEPTSAGSPYTAATVQRVVVVLVVMRVATVALAVSRGGRGRVQRWVVVANGVVMLTNDAGGSGQQCGPFH